MNTANEAITQPDPNATSNFPTDEIAVAARCDLNGDGVVALGELRLMAQVALNRCTAKPNVIEIPKSNSIERTDENCGASGWRLSSEQIDQLDQAFRVG